MDGDTRGGAALSIRSVTGKPILYIGMGEKLDDLQQFYPDRMTSRILGMGDVLTLIEKAEATVDEEKALEMQQKLRKASFTFDDFLEQMEQVKAASGQVAVLKSANMSLGINLLMQLLAQAATILAPAGFDMEIVEKHHNQKLDAPSGTALALADSMNDALGHVYEYKYDRSSERKKRDPHEIGISAVRGGSIVGEHEVIFAGLDEVIEFKHTAYSRSVFGKGAVEAAKFLAGKEAGFYDMQDVIRETMEQAD